MKKTALLLVIFFTVFNLFAQERKNSVSIYGQQSFIGGSLEFDYAFSTGKTNKVYAGIRYRFFDIMRVTDNQEYMFKNRFHPFEAYQKFGLILGDEYTFHIPNTKLRPFLFYNLQVAYMGIHNEFLDPFGTTDDGYQIFINNTVVADPMFVFENNIGIGGKVRLYKNLDLAFRIGMGVAVFNLEDTDYRAPAGIYSKYSNIGSLGLSDNY
jgi:hypothetical protein